jgi:hypothetical protein
MNVCGDFKVGDKVRVVKKVKDYDGWHTVWSDTMDAYVNNETEYLINARISGYGLKINNNWFPHEALELVESKANEGYFEKLGIDDGQLIRAVNSIKSGIPKPDLGAHYRHSIKVKLTDGDKENGFVMVQLDPAQIAEAYYPITGMRFTILKKVLRCGTGGKSYEHDLRDIIAAAERELELIAND